jgi:hypothetical protein
MRRAIAALLFAAALAGCGQGWLVSRQDAISKSAKEKGVASVTRRDAKLMTWPDFLRVSHVNADPTAAPPGKQKIWLVAVAGDITRRQGSHDRWVIFVYNAVTGQLIGDIVGSVDPTTGAPSDWPPVWDSFPDAG